MLPHFLLWGSQCLWAPDPDERPSPSPRQGPAPMLGHLYVAAVLVPV